VSEEARSSPAKTSVRRNFFLGFSNSSAQRDHGVRESKRRSMLAAARPSECWRRRRPGRKCPRKVNPPASQRELRIPLLRRHRSLTPENWLIRQAVPRTLRRAFSVPPFHTTDEERWKANTAGWKRSDRESGLD
jgi:hypothetical protein